MRETEPKSYVHLLKSFLSRNLDKKKSNNIEIIQSKLKSTNCSPGEIKTCRMRINLEHNRETYVLSDINGCLSIKELKTLIADQINLHRESFNLIHQNNKLNEDLRIEETCLVDDDIVSVDETTIFREFLEFKSLKKYNENFSVFKTAKENLDKIWNSVHCEYLKEYVDHPDHLLNLDIFILAFNILSNEAFTDDNYSDSTKAMMEIIFPNTENYNSRFHEFPEEFLFKDVSTGGDILDMHIAVKNASSARWKLVYNYQGCIKIYKGESPTDILMLYSHNISYRQYGDKYLSLKYKDNDANSGYLYTSAVNIYNIEHWNFDSYPCAVNDLFEDLQCITNPFYGIIFSEFFDVLACRDFDTATYLVKSEQVNIKEIDSLTRGKIEDNPLIIASRHKLYDIIEFLENLFIETCE